MSYGTGRRGLAGESTDPRVGGKASDQQSRRPSLIGNGRLLYCVVALAIHPLLIADVRAEHVSDTLDACADDVGIVSLVGPESFERTTGAPNEFLRTFEFIGEGTLCVCDGAADALADGRVNSAHIRERRGVR